MSRFGEKVLALVKEIPRGKVVSYGQVAAYVGVPRGARAVGWVLRQAELEGVPWWRVINNAGRISIKNLFHPAEEQRERLLGEGVEVEEDFAVNMEKYRFVAGEQQLRAWGLTPEYLEMVWRRFRG